MGQNQAHPLGSKEIKEFIESAGEGLRADRKRAMLCVAYETLARRGELVTLAVKDIHIHHDGTGIASRQDRRRRAGQISLSLA
jgi:site-specific recombinase XerD